MEEEREEEEEEEVGGEMHRREGRIRVDEVERGRERRGSQTDK